METVEITSVATLRRWYQSALPGWTASADHISMLARNARAQVTSAEQALGHLTSEKFDAQTIAEASDVQEATALALRAADAAQAAIEAAHAAIEAALNGLGRHAGVEEAVANSPVPVAASTSNYLPE